MTRIAIVYFSATGQTATLGAAAATGVRRAGGAPLDCPITGDDIVQGRFTRAPLIHTLTSCEGLLLGSPTYMGGVAAQFKAFADATSELWERQALAGKVAGGFTVGGAPNGDQGATLQYLSVLAAQHGMLWVGIDRVAGQRSGPAEVGLNPLGCQLGATALSSAGGVRDADLATAEYLGYRVAGVAAGLSRA